MKDKNYNLVTAVQRSLEWAWQTDTYAKDAEEAGDEELAEWFRKIQEDSQQAGEKGKKLLAERLEGGEE